MGISDNEERFTTPIANGELPADAYGGLDLKDPDFIKKFTAANGIKFVDKTKKG